MNLFSSYFPDPTMERGEEYFLHLPPGYRFYPSDEELIVHYLQNKVNLRSVPGSIIEEVELYKCNPWELPRKRLFGADELFFFSPRDRKYPKGSRPKRSAGSGFWKAMGKDKPIFASSGSKEIGFKKALAFFKGSPTKNVKTNWTMNEYRLPDSSNRSSRLTGSMRLDDWVLCRVRQKGNKSKNESELKENPTSQLPITTPPPSELPSSYMITNDIISDPGFKDFQLMASILTSQDLPQIIDTSSPKQFQDPKTSHDYGNDSPFMLNDMFASDDSYDVLDTIHLDGPFNQA